MDQLRVKFLYEEQRVLVRVFFVNCNENCLSWISPIKDLENTVEIQKQILRRVADTSTELALHNSTSYAKFLEISGKIEKAPGFLKAMCEDLVAIQKIIHRMKKKLKIPVYKPKDDE